MQTLEFTRAVRKIRDELKVKELSSIIAPWLNTAGNSALDESQKNTLSELLFESNAAYQHLLRDSTAGPILKTLEIAEFYEPSRLRMMLTTVSGLQQTSQLFSNWQAFSVFSKFFELLQSFLRWDLATQRLLEVPKITKTTPGDDIFELELVEYSDEAGISPRRLEIFARCIAALHTHLAVLYAIDNDKVTFKFFDSGSDVRVGIECAKAIAETLNTLFKEWWDKVLFWRYESFEKKVEAISKSLTLVGTIHDSVSKGAITTEVAENLKFRIFREVENLTQIGATVPLKHDATIDQRQFLTEVRNIKLLPEATPDESSSTEGPSTQA